MSMPVRLLLVALVATAASLTSIGAASAQSVRTTDARGDVYAISMDSDSDELSATNNVAHDIAAVTVTHGKHNVRLRMVGTDLRKWSGLMQYIVRTGKGVRVVNQYLGTTRYWQTSLIENAVGDRVPCRGARQSVDRSTEVARVVIPRRCLMRPASIKVAAFTVGIGADGSRIFVDDGLADGDPGYSATYTRWLTRN